VGVISAKGRSNLNFGRETPAYQNYIQTDASINPGNSGGPLLNINGECIGVNAAISSPTGGSVGIGFAIPINLARSVVPDLIATGKVSRGWLGVWLGRLTEQEARRQGLDALRGVKIDSVFQESPAERAGMRSGDIVLSIDGQLVDNNSQLSVLISQVKSGQPIPIEVARDGERLTLTTVIGDRESFLASVDDDEQGNPSDDFEVKDWLGMELMTFTEDVATALGIERVEGVYVRRVRSGSPAYNASIARGTIILQVNNESVNSIEDIDRISSELSGSSQRIPLIVVEPDGTVARKVIRL
jgi:serine protease Do